MNKSIVLKIEGKGFNNEYNITFPDVIKLRKIEEMKTMLSPMYRALAERGTILANYSLDIIDMQAYLTVLSPELVKDLKTPIDQMDVIDAKQLLNQFNKQFMPWWNKWIDIINEPIDKQDTENDDQQKQQEQ